MGIEMSVTEFKAKCLQWIEKLSRHEIDSIELTKRGKPVATVTATEQPKPRTVEDVMGEFKAFQARMAGSIKILDPDLDLTKPIFEDFEDFDAYNGRFFPDDE